MKFSFLIKLFISNVFPIAEAKVHILIEYIKKNSNNAVLILKGLNFSDGQIEESGSDSIYPTELLLLLLSNKFSKFYKDYI